MDSKLARAADRHRKLTLNQMDRHRVSAGRLHRPKASVPLVVRSRLPKVNQHQLSIKLSDEERALAASASQPAPQGDASASSDLLPHSSLRTTSLAEVMVEKPHRKSTRDSFELIGKPINRVMVLPDEVDEDEEHSRTGFPSLSKSKHELLEDGWERIGMDGEVEPADQAPAPKGNWLAALLGNRASA